MKSFLQLIDQGSACTRLFRTKTTLKFIAFILPALLLYTVGYPVQAADLPRNAGKEMNADALISISIAKTDVSACGNGSDGTLTATVSGGTAPYTFTWTGTNGFTANTASVAGLSQGYYNVLVTDANLDTASVNGIHISYAFSAVISNNGTVSASCTNTGSLILYGNAGVQPYTYSINGSDYQPGNTFTNLAAGNYTAYLKDLRGCISSKSVTVGSAAPIVITTYIKPASNCTSDGAIELFRTGGIPPYTYSLDGINYQEGNAFTNLAAGSVYTAWVKDSKGCTGSLTNVTVTQVQQLALTASVTGSSTCAQDGSIQLRPTGGVAPYTVSLDNVNYQSSTGYTGIAAGNYTGWVKDSKGCKSSVNITVGYNSINVTAYAANSSACENTGSIQLFRTGGIGPYTYSLDDITYQVSNSFTGLPGGSYTGWVKDSKGCKGSLAGITISQGSIVSLTARFSPSSVCVANGTIQLRATGGVAPYTFSIDDINYQSSSSFLGLVAGNYTGWVKDLNGCKASVNVSVGLNHITVFASTGGTNNCNTNGIIQLFRTGGTAPFTYSIDNIHYNSNNVFSNLPGGTYTGWVKDFYGCKSFLSGIVVVTGSALIVNTTKKNTSTCVNDGSIQVNPTGGTAPYTFSMNDVSYQGTGYFTQLSRGNYTVWVKDAAGCKTAANASINFNPIVVTATVTNVTNCAQPNGVIQVSKTGGTGGFMYSLDGDEYQVSNVFTGMEEGDYMAFVKDSNTCVGAAYNVIVGSTCSAVPNRVGRSIKPGRFNAEEQLVTVNAYPNPSNSSFTVKLNGWGNGRVTLTVTDILGRKVYKATGLRNQEFRFGHDFKPGLYQLQVSSATNKRTINLARD